jgi:hypothetical protein
VTSGRNLQYLVDDMPDGGRLAEMPIASAPARHRTCLEGAKGDQIIALGKAIKAARKGRGMTIIRAAAAAGISAALLSRLERGQLATSRVFCFHGSENGEPTLVVLNPWLSDLCALT